MKDIRIIACETIREELTEVLARTDCRCPVTWLESGLHNLPDLLRTKLQAAIDQAEESTLLLAMGFCGGALAGIRAERARLVLPVAEDCITLLCGSWERRKQHPCTYFFTEGWLRGERTIWNEYLHAIERYGQQRADRIFQTMLRNYKTCGFIRMGFPTEEAAGKEVQRLASHLGLGYETIPGSMSYLQQLLQGPWTEDRFLVVPPGAVISQQDFLDASMQHTQVGQSGLTL